MATSFSFTVEEKISCSVIVGVGTREEIPSVLRRTDLRSVVLFFDQKLEAHAQELVASLNRRDIAVLSIGLEVSESLKDLQQVSRIYDQLAKNRIRRGSTLLALGGGALGDLVGFVAGTYLRGINWIGIPTTLLAQVDSCLGGKTGVNLDSGKNLVGVFHHPQSIICDLEFLHSLSERDLRSGFSEMLKYGITLDEDLYEEFSEIDLHLLSPAELNGDKWTQWISSCLYLKAKIVREDPEDRKGIREVLNFGHTFGHALEAISQYRVYRHGEAVLLGMRLGIDLSVEEGFLSKETGVRLNDFLSKVPVPRVSDILSTAELVRLMKQDKKSRNGEISMVLLKGIGKGTQLCSVTETKVARAIDRLRRS